MLKSFRVGLGALFLSLATVIAASTTPAAAQDWPQRAVRFILPFGPGSAADTLARVLGEDLAVRWGKPVVVENRPGADGLLAINAVVGAKDDHTILVSSTGSFLAHPYMHKKLDYDIDKDLTPIGRVADTLLIVAVPADLPASNLKEFVALAKAKPDMNLAASPGVTEFAVDAFLKGEDLKTVRVPYKNLGDAARDLSEGRIHFILTSYAVVRPFVESGKVKIIAAGTRNRSPLVKDVQSIPESGFPVLAADTSTALFGGPGVPAELRKKIANDMMLAIKEPKVRDRIALTGQDIAPSGPEELTEILKGQFQKADAIAQSLGMKKAQ
jgi:tripartite-type tricarboxylate transporter receptor subunit TctC